MKKVLLCVFILFLGLYTEAWSQIRSNQASFFQTTNYPAGYTQDPMFIFCHENLIDIYANSPNGSALNFEWSIYNPTDQTFSIFKIENNVFSSSANQNIEGGYKVKITDATGYIVDVYKAWIFVSQVQVSANLLSNDCDKVNLKGSYTPVKDFTYYVMPKEPFIIDNSTIIKACFTIDHTQVSDVGFMIYGPASSGYPAVTIYPHPNPQNNPPQSLNCNNGNNINNLCFSSDLNIPYPVCVLPTPISGTFGWYRNGFSAGGGSAKYPQGSDNKALLNGAKATDAGWQVQFFDGTSGDVGVVKEVILTFINPNPNGYSPDSVELKSGSINFPITDNGDQWNTASKYNVPAYTNSTPTSPITIPYIANTNQHIANTSAMLWTSNQANTLFIPFNTDQTEASDLSVDDTTKFTFTISDEYGCWFSDSRKYLHKTPTIDSVTIKEPSCFGDSDGEIIIHSVWANSFSIDQGISTVASNYFVGLPSGTYNIQVNDGNTCFDTLTVHMNTGLTLQPLVIKNDNLCLGACQGNILLQISGGAAPYTFQWSNSPFNMNLVANLCAGNYQATIIDANGCDTTLNISISDPPALVISTSVNSSSCVVANGSATVQAVSGGLAPFTYQWSNGDTDALLDQVFGGNYAVTVTDHNGCRANSTVNIPQITVPIASLPNDTAICHGSSINLNAVVSSGVGPFTYLWSTGDVSSNIQIAPTSNTCYNVVVKDNNLCASPSLSVCIEVYDPIQSLNDITLYLCEGEPVSLNAAATGGNPLTGLTYTWSHGLGNSKQITFIPPFGWPQVENFQAIISDGGCSKNDTIQYTLTFYEPPTVQFSADQTHHCIPMDVEFSHLAGVYTNCIWDFGDGSRSTDCLKTNHTYQEVGTYDVTLTLEYGSSCYRSLTMPNFITAEAPPVVDFSILPEKISVTETVAFLEDNTQDSIIEHHWAVLNPNNPLDTLYSSIGTANTSIDFDQIFKQNGPHIFWFDDQTDYPIAHQVVTQYGCKGDVVKNIEFDKSTQIYAPNTFTPDKNQINDTFHPICVGINPTQDYEFTILDRWGTVVFASNNIEDSWNGSYQNSGEAVQDGIFIWQLKYADIKNKLRETQGSVLVLKK